MSDFLALTMTFAHAFPLGTSVYVRPDLCSNWWTSERLESSPKCPEKWDCPRWHFWGVLMQEMFFLLVTGIRIDPIYMLCGYGFRRSKFLDLGCVIDFFIFGSLIWCFLIDPEMVLRTSSVELLVLSHKMSDCSKRIEYSSGRAEISPPSNVSTLRVHGLLEG